MTLVEKLKNHKGGLIRIRTQLWWYGIGLDNKPGRVCLVVDANNIAATAFVAEIYPTATMYKVTPFTGNAAALLLIDGSPQWVFVFTEYMELINDST